MVKIEEYVENGDIGEEAFVDSKPFVGQVRVKEEQDAQPSSSSSHSRSQFIDMGFSPTLVDKVLAEIGENDSNSILESLLSYSALQKSGSESSGPLEGLFDSNKEEQNSPLEFGKEANQDIKLEPDSFSGKRSYLLRTMNFSEREVDLVFNQLGEEAPLEQLVDQIVMAQLSGNQNGDPTNEGKAEALFGVMEKTLRLLQMGFTEEEVSSAIDNSGPEASVMELADSILASRIASSIEKKEVKIESEFLGETETEYSSYHPSNYNGSYYDEEEKLRVKKAKHIFIDDNGASSSRSGSRPSLSPWLRGRWGSSDGSVKEEPDVMTPGLRANVHGDLAKPPYFFYGNVVEIPKDTWRQLSQFLFTVEPEFVNSQFFSALIRKEGYIHNLPTERRLAVVPKSPMTIEDALPFTRQWWPSWDTRKQISGVTTGALGVEQICEKLGKMMRDSRGVLSQEQQMHILHQCKISNLVWVGQDRLSPLEPRQLERILGYPPNHTSLFGLNPPDRIAAMKYAFQTDTLAYLLSVLKGMYPDGLRVLSIYSGIGGIEVALHRLGIHLKCIVSIEESDVNRKILRRWWGKTEQTGELRQLGGIWKLKTYVLEDLVKEFGGFDLIVGGNPSACTGGSTINTTMGMDSNLFFEFVRVLQRVRSIVGSIS